MPLIAIVIPCFNEEKRLLSGEIIHFLRQHPHYNIVLINDGSTDKTGQVINDLQRENPAQLLHLELTTNNGKANAVRQGFLFSLMKKKYHYIGYLDADFSTSLKEMFRLTDLLINQKLEFAFGSRMKKLNAHISRSGFRHIAGRIMTTIINSYYDLGIYDTQCGAKLFSASLAEIICKESFVTNWLFDVEIFLRIKQYCPSAAGEEIPLLEWNSRRGSKITILNAPGLMVELINLIRNYPVKHTLHA